MTWSNLAQTRASVWLLIDPEVLSAAPAQQKLAIVKEPGFGSLRNLRVNCSGGSLPAFSPQTSCQPPALQCPSHRTVFPESVPACLTSLPHPSHLWKGVGGRKNCIQEYINKAPWTMAASSRRPPETPAVPSSLPMPSASTPSMPARAGGKEWHVAGAREGDVNSRRTAARQRRAVTVRTRNLPAESEIAPVSFLDGEQTAGRKVQTPLFAGSQAVSQAPS